RGGGTAPEARKRVPGYIPFAARVHRLVDAARRPPIKSHAAPKQSSVTDPNRPGSPPPPPLSRAALAGVAGLVALVAVLVILSVTGRREVPEFALTPADAPPPEGRGPHRITVDASDPE